MSAERGADLGESALEAIRRDPGDQQGWTQFYEYFRRQIAGALYLKGVERRELPDMSQEVFRRFLEASPWSRNWRTLPARPVVAAYLRRIAFSLLVDRARAAKRRGEEAPASQLDTLPAPATFEDVGIPLGSLLERLDADDRNLLRLLVDGVSLDAIAFELGVSYGAAAVRVHRLKARLYELSGQR